VLSLFLLSLITLSLLCTACGGSARPSSDTASATGAGTGGGVAMILAFSRCMRAGGVPNYPDPTGNGNLDQTGIDTSSPAFRQADAKCSKRDLHGSIVPPGSDTHPSALALATMLAVAHCMREHGVPWFPDPTTYIPSSLPAGSEATNVNGAVMVFLPQQMAQATTAVYQKKAKTCQALSLTNH
jgi:hypothetical protein